MEQQRRQSHPLKVRLALCVSICWHEHLPITSWIVRHAALLLSHFQVGSADVKTAYARQAYVRQFGEPCESPMHPFVERVMWKDPTLQPAQLRSSWG